jgi:hypothetical protein
MTPFITFIAIIVVIWTLSGIATAVNKKNEAERRRQLALQLQRASTQQSRAPSPQRRRISEGIAARFPDVLLPPARLARPAPPRVAVQAMPPKRPPAPQQRKKQQQKQQRRAAAPQQRRVAAPPPPPPPVPASTFAEASAPLSTAAPAVQSARERAAAAPHIADAVALARWAKPATLRQQFMLTEIFQPPLALRDQP